MSNKLTLAAVGIFILALFVRLGYLYDSSDNPTFDAPVVDSLTYDLTARSLADGNQMTDDFFWQPFFYPFFLSAVYFFSNSSILCARIIQLLLGCVTCVLTFRLGQRIFNSRTGILAGIITALYAPLVFFEAELLAAGWATFWSVVLLLLFLKARPAAKPWLCFVLGACAALSIITRPTFVLFWATGCVWLAVVWIRDAVGTKKLVFAAAAAAAGFALVAVLVGLQSYRVAGKFTILPYSGGINLYIGNNPDFSRTVTSRPGFAWEQLIQLPIKHGITDNYQWQRFFLRKTIDYVINEPTSFVKGLLYKAAQFFTSREIPRNVDIYLFRQWSAMLRAGLWQVAGFGFPFGLLLPLAVVGAIFSRRAVPAPVWLFVILYPLSVILVFVTARYRVVIVPVVTIFAAAGCINIVRILQSRRFKSLAIATAVILGIGWAATAAGPFPEEQLDFEAELYYTLAESLKQRGRSEDAIKAYSKAVELRGDYTEAVHNLGSMLAARGRVEEAIAHYNAALKLNPENAVLHNDAGVALFGQGKIQEALAHYKEALRIDPQYARACYNIANVHALQGKLDQAAAQFKKAIQLDPGLAFAHYNLGIILKKLGKISEAIEEWEKTLEIDPDHPDAHFNMALTTAEQGKYDQAAKHFNEVLRIKPDRPEVHGKLGDIYYLQGRFNLAIQNYSEMLRFIPDQPDVLKKLGHSFYQAGEIDEAIKHWIKSLHLEPDQPEIQSYTGVALTKQKKYDEAIKYFTNALCLKPDMHAAHRRLAVVSAQMGRVDEAITHYKESLRLEPNQPMVHKNLGELYFLQENIKQAISCWEKLLELKPEQVDVINNLAWVKATQENPDFRNPDEAVRLALRACELTEYKKADFLDTLAVAYAATGKFAEAMETAEKAIKLAASADRKDLAEEIRGRLQLYKAQQPYSELPRAGGKDAE